jgi:Flp pilus assembly protein TadG
MIQFARLKREEEGAAAVEMALALPILVSIIYGIFQVGLLYQANAGMQHALGEGARMATLCIPSGTTCTTPSNDQIKTRMSAKLFGKGDGTFTVQEPGTGAGYRDLRVTYVKKMNFLFINGPTITLNREKRAYVADTQLPNCSAAQVAAGTTSGCIIVP